MAYRARARAGYGERVSSTQGRQGRGGEMPLPPCKLGDSASTPPRQRGLTLIELLVALVVMIIMVGWAVPSYQRMTARQEVSSEVLRLKTALSMTRSAAITRRTQVALCPTVVSAPPTPHGAA